MNEFTNEMIQQLQIDNKRNEHTFRQAAIII